MLGLCQHVSGKDARVAVFSEDHDFCGAGDKVNRNLASQELFRSRDPDTPRSYDAVGFRDSFGSKSESRDRVGTPGSEELTEP
jgi:hypothetical protein